MLVRSGAPADAGRGSIASRGVSRLEVRPAGRDEFEVVLALWRRADAHPSVSDDPASIRRLLEHDPGALLVATVDGAVVGTLIAAWDGWRGNFYRLAVLPEHRRQGIASALVEAGESRLRALGAARVTAIVVTADDPAIAFWRAAGYDQQDDRTRFVKNCAAD